MLHFFCHYTSSKSLPLKPVKISLTIFDRSFSLDPTIAFTKICLYTTQAESHLHMTITTIVTTYPFLNLRISTITRLERIYVRFVSPSIIRCPIQSSFIHPHRKKGMVGIQARARSHRDTSPTQRVSRCHLLLYF
jgi:hypothetical protein